MVLVGPKKLILCVAWVYVNIILPLSVRWARGKVFVLGVLGTLYRFRPPFVWELRESRQKVVESQTKSPIALS